MYTTPMNSSNPLSWAATRQDVADISDADFERHAARFYRGGSSGRKGLWGNIKNLFTSSPDVSTPTTLQRPGFIQGFEGFWNK